MYRNFFGMILVIAFYVVLMHIVLDFPYPATYVFFPVIFLTAIIFVIFPFLLLRRPNIQEVYYDSTHLFLVVVFSHILLVSGLVVYIGFFVKEINNESILEFGYQMFISSIVFTVIVLIRDIKRPWALITLGVEVILFVIFIRLTDDWRGYLMLPGLLTMIFLNVFVFSYGVMRYILKFHLSGPTYRL